MKGTLNYSEYSCPCGGRTERRKVDVRTEPEGKSFINFLSADLFGIIPHETIFTYYYECMDCDITSEEYEADITHKFK